MQTEKASKTGTHSKCHTLSPLNDEIQEVKMHFVVQGVFSVSIPGAKAKNKCGKDEVIKASSERMFSP